MAELKPYSKYKDSGVEWMENVPKDWKKTKISWLFSNIGSGGTPSSRNLKYYEQGNINWVNTGDLNDHYLKQTKNKITGEAMKDVTTLKLYPENSLIIAMYGATIGKLAITQIESTTNQACCVMNSPVNTSIKFMYYWFLTSREDIINSSSGGGQPNISQSLIRNLKVILPKSVDEQNRIVQYLDEKTSRIESLISEKEGLIKLLEEKRQAIITETVTKGLDPNVKMKDSGIEWIGEIPAHWEVQKLKRISNVELSNVDKKTVINEEPVLLCNYVDVYYNNVIKSNMDFMKATAKKEQIKKFSLKKGDVIITKDSESSDDIAIPAWVSKTMENVLCGYHLAQIRPKSNLSGRFLLYQLLSKNIQEQFHSLAYGVTRHGILKGDIENGLFSVPPFQEQEEIIRYLTQIDNEIVDITQNIKVQISKLKEYRESLIYEAVTGKIDLRNVERNTREQSIDEYGKVAEENESYQ